MSLLLIFIFDHETGAQEMIANVQALQRRQLLTLSDAASVIRKQDGRIEVKQANSLVGAGAVGGAFWGMLIGLLFLPQWQDLPDGAAAGAIMSKDLDCGLDNTFIKEASSTILPGFSALFMMVAHLAEEKVLAELTQQNAVLMRTNLSAEDDAKLREVFGVGVSV